MSDKRSVTTDALEVLGNIIDETVGRDAIHLAVEPAVAAVKLYPGQDIGFVDGGFGPCDKPVGIVDPFLKHPVQPGQRFLLVVYPRTITSLRHVWVHPAFDKPQTAVVESRVADPLFTPEFLESKRWLENFAATMPTAAEGEDEEDRAPITYARLMERAKEHAQDGSYWSEGGRFEGFYADSDFWDHYEIVTGDKVPNMRRGNFFSCSC